MAPTTAKPAPTPSLTPVSGVTTWLLALIAVLLAGVALAAVAALVAVASGLGVVQAVELIFDPRSSPLVTHPTWIVVTILLNEVAVAIVIWLCLRRLHLRLLDVAPLRVPTLQQLFGSLVLVFGLAPLAELCAELSYRYVSHDLLSEQVVLVVARGTTGIGFVFVVLVAAVVPAVVEETFFRGVLLRAFESYGVYVSVLATSLLFALLHLEPTQAAGTFVLGIGFGMARVRTGSIVPPILGHALYNAAVVTAERWLQAPNTHELSWGRAAIGVLAAAFGFWLMGSRRPAAETL